MKQILITGGTGFFGKSLLRADLFPEDTQLFLLSRNGLRSKIPCKAKVIPVFGDVRTVDLSGFTFDSVIHAAAPSGGGATDEEMYSILTDGTAHLLEELKKMGTVKRLLYVSSGAVYGKQEKEFAEETDPLNPVTLYGKGKVEAEQMCLNSGIPCVIARCFAFAGEFLPKNTHFAIGNFLADLEEKRTIHINGDGSPIRSYLYADDLAQWLVTLLNSGRPGEAYNVGSEEAISIRELAEKIAFRAMPPLSVEINGVPTGEKPQRYLPSTAKIRSELGLPVPRTLDDSLQILAPVNDFAMRDQWLAMEDEALSAECLLDFHKASGNGGQHVNKTSSAVRVKHAPSGLEAVCSEHRSQHDNRRCALNYLRMRIAFQIRRPADPGFRVGDPPVSMKNHAYPLWLAKLLDVFAESEYNPRLTAEKTGTGSSKLIKLFYRDSSLWQCVQNMRTAAGLSPLKSPEK
ncbi:MAG: NAD-dependent epimerase/dehydratase family protein [Lentisphaeria bacterium]|nr:NAD-dependent epimerase/dehydratase family protein [Lentisphaeria bacterium]